MTIQLRKLTLEDVKVSIVASPESDESPKDHFPPDLAYRIIMDAYRYGNVWAWCTITVRVEWNDLHGSDSIGCSHYGSEAAFKADGYYPDMLKEALIDLNEKIQIKYDQIQALLVNV